MGSQVHVGVIGGGAWGTALAIHAARAGHDVVMWAREAQVVNDINDSRENKIFLPGFEVPSRLSATTDLQACVTHAQLLLTVTPTPYVSSVVGQCAPWLREDHILVSCSKGIENNSLELVSEILERNLPTRFHSQIAYLSGPSFAKEVALQHPTAVTVASYLPGLGHKVQQLLSTNRFRCYTTRDVVGVEMGGALKNVMAICTGAADGLGFGYNARAGLITRGLGEISRMAVRKGANPLTLQGLAGMGDLVLTCTGELSRNRSVGKRLGAGETLDEILASTVTVAEGVLTSRSAWQLAQKLGVAAQVPIIEGAYRVLWEGQDLMDALEALMARPLKDEWVPQ
ncbi:MAG TPA: glycerol-3-phosphate dehydrogenase [Myxococcales bacterium]|nr:glycerol-3-phosphate dehydrogenase [Myxococcales bacterium]HAN32656.1 glycerol-3-phosphate dehydrogenase [Myxococcales bacterium]